MPLPKPPAKRASLLSADDFVAQSAAQPGQRSQRPRPSKGAQGNMLARLISYGVGFVFAGITAAVLLMRRWAWEVLALSLPYMIGVGT